MADTKLTALTELNETPASGDWLYIVDVSDTTDGAGGSSRKITRSNTIGGLATSGANSNITSLTGLTTPLSTAQGGTGAGTFTAGGILTGNTTSAIAVSAAGTAGQAVVSGGTGVPTFTTGTLTLAGNFSTSGTSALILTTTASTNVTLPTTGTLITLAGSETLTNKTITSPSIGGTVAGNAIYTSIVLTTPQINDTSLDHQYIFAASELTADRTVTLPLLTGNDDFVFEDHTQTMTNKRISPRIVTTTDDATAVIDVDVTDQYQLTAVANATTISTTGTPVNGQKLVIRLKDAGVGKGLTWDGVFRAVGVTLPTTTVASKTHYIGSIYNSADTKWDAVAVVAEA